MPSTLSWLDHDHAAAERSMRLLHLFKERESRDEFGIGGIRDAIADQLFPGTSTIQTRLRYVFFIPWLFAQMEENNTPSLKYQDAGKQAESRLLQILCKTEPTATGIIGRNAGSEVKQQPSSVYWTALGSWGIRNGTETRQQYFAHADRRHARRSQRRRRDDNEIHDDEATGVVWHAGILKLCPPGFPEGCGLALSADEARFLLDRWTATQRDSLLTWLALDLRHRKVAPQPENIWAHPQFADFPTRIKALIVGGRKVAAAMRGAALLYNLQLAELERRDKLVTDYESRLSAWKQHELADCADWKLAEFWPLVIGKGHSISLDTQHFLESWRAIAVAEGDSSAARQLIAEREMKLKGARSRFTNPAARKQWSGAAGTAPLTYRWPVVREMLAEWHAGWRRK
ncbi:DUF6361 family protein [Massilia horti]|uniref:Uncharacterized protein n=1 Tax=Massilia horti TaxID=2562153 RepID=A0A4Y9T0W3_9BURK|nr:DUF6361 family protein [Massilia horti]TFW32912.1 hypothetical protein E4O92_08280 [Massilia horti]